MGPPARGARRRVAVVGGGPAGLAAAQCLGRARRSVVVIDRGEPRHAVAEGVHNFLTRDGLPPAELRRAAWEQMRAYPSVQRHHGSVHCEDQQGGGACFVLRVPCEQMYSM